MPRWHSSSTATARPSSIRTSTPHRAAKIAAHFDVPFHHLPVAPDTRQAFVRGVKGRDIEQQVLAAPPCWHVEHRVLVYAGETVVFD